MARIFEKDWHNFQFRMADSEIVVAGDFNLDPHEMELKQQDGEEMFEIIASWNKSKK